MPDINRGEESESEDDMYDDSNTGLKNDEKVVLKSVFRESIRKGEKLSMHEFRHKMRAEIFLREFVTDAKKVKKMYDFVRA